MIPRYARPEMAALWSDDARYARWLRVELAVCEAWARRGIVPADALARIRQRAAVDAGRIATIEARVHHDVIAFLTDLEAAIGADSRFVHLGLTSSDVVDTALALALVEAADRLIAGVGKCVSGFQGLAQLRHFRFEGLVWQTVARRHRAKLCWRQWNVAQFNLECADRRLQQSHRTAGGGL